MDAKGPQEDVDIQRAELQDRTALKRESVRWCHFVWYSSWVVDNGGLVGQKSEEKAKYFSFLLEKSFGHKNNTAALAMDISGHWSSSVAKHQCGPWSDGSSQPSTSAPNISILKDPFFLVLATR
ncbi:hypothetical protein STEG23_006144, partial [Scotinomys teguina]